MSMFREYLRIVGKINLYERKAHQPWGGAGSGTDEGGIVSKCYFAAQTELGSYYGDRSVNSAIHKMDMTRRREHNHGRFIRTNSCVEKIRR